MKKATPLQKVLTVTEKKERDAAVIVAQIRQRLEVEKQRLETLDSYYLEYCQRQFQGAQGSNPTLVRNYAHFIRKVQFALEDQKNKFQKMERDLNKALQHWKKINDTITGINQVLDNYAADALRLQNKVEQIMLDEWSGRQHESATLKKD